MKFISLILFLPTLCWGKIQLAEDKILPLKMDNYPIEKFISDYADVMGKTILVDKDVNRKEINLTLNQAVHTNDFEKMFLTILESHGYAVLEEGSFLKVIHSRDVRYTPTPLFDSTDFPTTDQYILVFHKLKNPLASEITRNMRPFMSRYGRIIDFNDAHSIAVQDIGKNIARLLSLIDALDNPKSLERLKKNIKLGKHKKHNNKGESKEELEIEILKLQKRKLEEEMLMDNSSPSKRRM